MPLSEESKAKLNAIVEPIQRRKKSKFLTSTKFQTSTPKELAGFSPEGQEAATKRLAQAKTKFESPEEAIASIPEEERQQTLENLAKPLTGLEKLPTVGEVIPEDPFTSRMKEGQSAPEAVIKGFGAGIGGTVTGIPQAIGEATDFVARGVELGSTPVETFIALAKGDLDSLPQRSFITENTRKFADVMGGISDSLQRAFGLDPDDAAVMAGEIFSPVPAAGLLSKTSKLKPITKTKNLVKEATGKGARARQVSVAEETRGTFKGAEAKAAQFEESKGRSKAASSELLKEKGKLETVTGEKAKADFSKTKFSNKRVQNEVTERFLNNADEVIDRGDLANNALKISEMTPTGGQSNFAATKVRKYVLDNTSEKFAKLNDEFSEASRAIDAIDTKAFVNSRSITQEMKLSPSMKARIAKIKNPKDKEALIKALLEEKKSIGKAMDAEITNLKGQTVSGDEFRAGLEDTLSEQGVKITREPVTEINKKDLDEIIKANPDDPRVQQLVQDRKIIEAGKPSKTAASLQSKIIKDGNPDLQKTKELLLQIEPTAEGDLLRSILPKELVDEIVKTRIITKKNAIKLGSLIGAGKILEFVSGSDVPFF